MKLSIGKLRLSALQLCVFGGALLTLLACITRTLALTLCFDAPIGYFQTGKAPVILTYVLQGLAIALCVAFPFLIKKEGAPAPLAAQSTVGLIGAGCCALLLIVNAIYLLLNWQKLPAPELLLLLCALFSVPGAGYFAAQFRERNTESGALCGYGLILTCVCMLAVTYFDRYTQMNAPHKTSLHFCMLAIMLAVLYEVRSLIGRDLPRVRVAMLLLAFFFCATVGLSNTIAFLAGSYGDLCYLFQDLFCLFAAVYFGARLFDLALPRNKDGKEAQQS